jgi:hypothetical protein
MRTRTTSEVATEILMAHKMRSVHVALLLLVTLDNAQAFAPHPRCCVLSGHQKQTPARFSHKLASAAVSSQELLSPPWVTKINNALEKGAAAYFLTYVLLDLGTALVFCIAFLALRVNVSAEFALAFAISKSPPLRGPRLGLDTAAAAALTRAFPSLAAVRVSLLADAMGRFAGVDELAKRLSGSEGPANATASSGPRQRRVAKVAEATRRITDEFGLAYLAVKNILGPISIFVIYAAVRACARGAGSESIPRASEFVARVALGPGVRSFDGVRLPSVGQTAGCVALASTVSALLFPLIVVASARLAPTVASWVAARVGVTPDAETDIESDEGV